MKYKVGDIVRVHSKEWFEKNCSKNCIGAFVYDDSDTTFVSRMTRFCGKEITINNVFWNTYHSVTYNILEDDSEWNWEDWMFEDMNNNTNTISNPNIVEDFAKLSGVELDEEFYDSEGGFHYKFTSDSGLTVYDDMVEDAIYCNNRSYETRPDCNISDRGRTDTNRCPTGERDGVVDTGSDG